MRLSLIAPRRFLPHRRMHNPPKHIRPLRLNLSTLGWLASLYPRPRVSQSLQKPLTGSNHNFHVPLYIVASLFTVMAFPIHGFIELVELGLCEASEMNGMVRTSSTDCWVVTSLADIVIKLDFTDGFAANLTGYAKFVILSLGLLLHIYSLFFLLAVNSRNLSYLSFTQRAQVFWLHHPLVDALEAEWMLARIKLCLDFRLNFFQTNNACLLLLFFRHLSQRMSIRCH